MTTRVTQDDDDDERPGRKRGGGGDDGPRQRKRSRKELSGSGNTSAEKPSSSSRMTYNSLGGGFDWDEADRLLRSVSYNYSSRTQAGDDSDGDWLGMMHLQCSWRHGQAHSLK
jgi:hypothetical protein